jgi:hypothetical protein
MFDLSPLDLKRAKSRFLVSIQKGKFKILFRRYFYSQASFLRGNVQTKFPFGENI